MPRIKVDYHNCPPVVQPCPFTGWHFTCPYCFHDGPFDSAAEANDEAVLHLREVHRA